MDAATAGTAAGSLWDLVYKWTWGLVMFVFAAGWEFFGGWRGAMAFCLGYLIASKRAALFYMIKKNIVIIFLLFVVIAAILGYSLEYGATSFFSGIGMAENVIVNATNISS